MKYSKELKEEREREMEKEKKNEGKTPSNKFIYA